jgi:hypothetical protein
MRVSFVCTYHPRLSYTCSTYLQILLCSCINEFVIKACAHAYTAFFFVLLRKCLSSARPVARVCMLGATVCACMALTWGPFCVWRASDQTCLSALGAVLLRIFPLNRYAQIRWKLHKVNGFCSAQRFVRGQSSQYMVHGQRVVRSTADLYARTARSAEVYGLCCTCLCSDFIC